MDFRLFGKRLRKLRQEQGISIKELAPKLDITYMHLSNIELGYKKPSPKLVKAVSDFFKPDPLADLEELQLLAAQIPEDISEYLQRHPKEAPRYLRSRFKKNGEDEK